jgi:RimJ/RimL family protein N-acetyltransferase
MVLKTLMMHFELQPTLENEFIKLEPLKEEDFETLYSIASNPEIWEQHPNKDRYKRPVFETFFKGAMESKAAFLVYDTQTNVPIGSRYYNFDYDAKSLAIGYTFLAKDHWGGAFNRSLKTVMLNHAFTFFDKVILHIGAYNIRSQKATEKLGAKKIDEIEMEYYGEPNRLNFVYQIDKETWLKK